MDEHKDPMKLWVGTWTPKDVIDREMPRLTPAQSDEAARESVREQGPSQS